MFRQPDSLYAGVLLCSAIILAVVGGSLFWLRMPGDERLRNYRLSRRFVGWAYFSLAFTDVLWLLFLREEYELDFTRILVLAVAAVQATMFSGALVTLVNSRFPLARGVRRHLLAVAAGTASLFGCMLFFPQAFPVLFRLTAAAYCVQIALFARTFVREYRVCRRKLDNFFFGRRDAPSAMGGRVVSDDGLDRTDGRGMAGVGVRDALPVCFYGGLHGVLHLLRNEVYQLSRGVRADRSRDRRRCAGAFGRRGEYPYGARRMDRRERVCPPGAFAGVAGPRGRVQPQLPVAVCQLRVGT